MECLDGSSTITISGPILVVVFANRSTLYYVSLRYPFAGQPRDLAENHLWPTASCLRRDARVECIDTQPKTPRIRPGEKGRKLLGFNL